ncbi:MAG: ATP-grasp domain-containing protein [Phycisphaeraceae bacterium]
MFRVMVLAGGPDRERAVSEASGAQIARALQDIGHEVRLRDILPDDLSALDEFARWRGQVIFPILHGAWGEGGPLQRILDQRGLCYVGCRAPAAELCMDKAATKAVLARHGLPTPASEVLSRGQKPTLAPPLVIKPLADGSSIDVVICRSAAQLDTALADVMTRNDRVLIEQFIQGKELTVGVIGVGDQGGIDSRGHPRCPTCGYDLHGNDTGICPECGAVVDVGDDPQRMMSLPPIQIIPATEFYDYEAKYVRDDTQYLFDFGASPAVMAELGRLARETCRVLGVRHLCRVDLFLDAGDRPWIIEVNTLPGFTTHSLLPKAAARAGAPMHVLVDRLVRLALREA